jgi:phosphopantothenoylcysteine decarboxylase/phosphopantothenate--cysteine ligase
MSDLLITSGPTRQYLDPVRYLTNASSGRMGAALATAAIERGWSVTVVSGPVSIAYPTAARVVPVLTTEQMLKACLDIFPNCQGMIGVAAPCDYMPRHVHSQKIAKTGEPLLLELVETPDIVASVATGRRPDQWVVGFALESEDHRFRALAKLERKCCDLIVSNAVSAIDAEESEIEILDRRGEVLRSLAGPKQQLANEIVEVIDQHLRRGHTPHSARTQ